MNKTLTNKYDEKNIIPLNLIRYMLSNMPDSVWHIQNETIRAVTDRSVTALIAWYTGWDSNPQEPEPESGAYASSATGANMVRSPGIEPGTC